MYANITEVKRAVKNVGGHWFDNDAYHGARRETPIIGGFYWVESTWSDAGNSYSPRVYRAVGVSPTGDVQYLSGGDKFDTVEAAKAVINAIIDGR